MAVLLAYFLDPVVTWMERMRIPRALGSLADGAGYAGAAGGAGMVARCERVDQFSRDWPKYRAPLRSRVGRHSKSRMESLEARVSEIEPGAAGPRAC